MVDPSRARSGDCPWYNVLVPSCPTAGGTRTGPSLFVTITALLVSSVPTIADALSVYLPGTNSIPSENKALRNACITDAERIVTVHKQHVHESRNRQMTDSSW